MGDSQGLYPPQNIHYLTLNPELTCRDSCCGLHFGAGSRWQQLLQREKPLVTPLTAPRATFPPCIKLKPFCPAPGWGVG